MPKPRTPKYDAEPVHDVVRLLAFVMRRDEREWFVAGRGSRDQTALRYIAFWLMRRAENPLDPDDALSPAGLKLLDIQIAKTFGKGRDSVRDGAVAIEDQVTSSPEAAATLNRLAEFVAAGMELRSLAYTVDAKPDPELLVWRTARTWQTIMAVGRALRSRGWAPAEEDIDPDEIGEIRDIEHAARLRRRHAERRKERAAETASKAKSMAAALALERQKILSVIEPKSQPYATSLCGKTELSHPVLRLVQRHSQMLKTLMPLVITETARPDDAYSCVTIKPDPFTRNGAGERLRITTKGDKEDLSKALAQIVRIVTQGGHRAIVQLQPEYRARAGKVVGCYALVKVA